MPEGTLLPPVAAKPANLAAPAAAGAPSSTDTVESGGPAFGDVLKGQMARADGKGATSPPVDAERTDDSTETAEDGGVAGLLTMLSDNAPSPILAPVDAMHAVIRRVTTDAGAGEGSRRTARTGSDAIVQTTSHQERGADPADARSSKTEVREQKRTDVPEFQAFLREPEHAGQEVVAVAGARASRGVRDLSEPAVVSASVSGLATHTTAVESLKATDATRVAETQTVRPSVSVPVGADGWADAVADRVTWVMQSRAPTAELQLNPPNLGPVEVRVSVTGDQASVSFFSPHATVRDALQSAVPRLSDAFSSAGVSLGDVFVGADARSGQQSSDGRPRGGRRDDSEAATGTIAPLGESRWTSGLTGVRAVDLFA
ncbi:MAG: flagellar hook-length control protein FliK [Burkholderiales bacterium]